MEERAASRASEYGPTELLMLTGVVHPCPDCGDERLFVAIDADLAAEFACCDCGAVVLIDPGFVVGTPSMHVA